LKIKIKQLPGCEDIPLPKYMSEHASGMDLFAAVEKKEVLLPGEYKLIPTGISVAVPPGYEAQVRPRSGLAFKHGISITNSPGTIDADYRGPVGVILHNLGKEEFAINRGDRIAQMVITQVTKIDWDLVEDLDKTSRNEGGFGHTGK
jgi:dUTP pyrophosphatase